MKKPLLTLMLLIMQAVAFAQAPQGIPYQAVARNSAGAILPNQAVGVRFTIRDSIATGAIKYRETFNPTTNNLGLFNVNVGTGTVVSGTFSGINWGTNAKFMQVEMDPAGGTSYMDMGTQQMMSVPYALYSGSTASGGSGGFTHFVGEQYGGGVVFHVFKDAAGIEHGLVVSLTDQSASATWSNVTGSLVGVSAQSSWDGLSNSTAIIGQPAHASSAAKQCLDLVSGGQSDWYLPSRDELTTLYNAQFNVNRALSAISGATQLSEVYYWSSTEYVAASAWAITFNSGTTSIGAKGVANYVRAIRTF